MCIACCLLVGGCRKAFEEVKEVRFEVGTEKAVYKVGEPVRFSFEGNPDFITIYSGEEGNDYAFAAMDRVIDTRMTFSFNSMISDSGEPDTPPNPAIVPLSYSSDFSGEYTLEAMNKATWTDITSLFTYPTIRDSPTVNSGIVDITDLFQDSEKPLYFRFAYELAAFHTTPVHNGRSQWTINGTVFGGIAGEDVMEVYDFPACGWKLVLGESHSSKPNELTNINGSRILFRDAYQPDTDRQAYAISEPIKRVDNVNRGPDMGKGIKAMAESTLEEYTWYYDTPGDYNVTFVAANANTHNRKETVRSVKITVVEDTGSIEQPGQGEL